MPKKTKKFIDKKHSVTFHLVHRSQQDPLVADENAPQFVLLPKTDAAKGDIKKQVEEQQKYGIFFDDDYNYLQHLKSTSTTAVWEPVQIPSSSNDSKLKLPSSVFASTVEEEVGMLNKAVPISGPRLDLDPDVVAAMDEDFDYLDPQNQLEDNFMELANASCSEDSDDEELDEKYDVSNSDYDEDEKRDEVPSLNGDGSEFSFEEEETKTRFTNYSMSSSVIRRNEQLTLLDDRFERMYISYDENEIGPLDCEEIEGFVPETSDILLQYADEFEKTMKREKLDKDLSCPNIRPEPESGSESNNDDLDLMPVEEKQKWDCESILSTYSNLYNHPKIINEPPKTKIKINMKTGMPVNVLGSNKLTIKAVHELNEQNRSVGVGKGPRSIGLQSVISTLSTRSKNESPQERKDRKKLLKNYRRERRIEKKANSEAFKEEAKKQIKIVINNKNNVQGNKIV